ncbi:hypothetical protein ACKWTF_014169 [Chironomus riparius]
MIKKITKLFLIILQISLSKPVQLSCKLEIMNFSFYTNQNCCCVIGDFTVYHRNENVIISLNQKSLEFNCFVATNKKLFYLPKNIGKTLNIIEIKNSNLKEISSEVLQNYKDLKYLDLSGNKIEILEGNLFQFNTKLEDINLRNNKIFAGALTTFDNMINLKFLNLGGNACISLVADDKKELERVKSSFRESCGVNVHQLRIIFKNSEGIREFGTIFSNEKVEIRRIIDNKFQNLNQTVLSNFNNLKSSITTEHDAIKANINDIHRMYLKIEQTQQKMAQNNTKLLDKIEICLQKVNDAQLSYDKKFEMLAEENAALKFKVMTQQNDTTEKLDETSNDHSIWILVLIILNITLLVILTIVLVFLLQSKKSSTPENHKTTDASNYEEITQKQISDPIYASADYTHTINDSFYDVQEEYEVIRETECDENIYSASADSDDFYLQTNVIEVHRPDCVEGDADIYAVCCNKS